MPSADHPDLDSARTQLAATISRLAERFKPIDPFAGLHDSLSAQIGSSGQDLEATIRAIAHASEARTAKGMAEHVIQRIREFEAALDAAHEVGLLLVSLGQQFTIHVSGIGYIQPSLLLFSGVTEHGEPIELVQHTSQLSFLLLRVPRLEPERPRAPIGFAAFAE